MKNILISPVGGRVVHGIVEYFKSKRFRIVGIDSNQEAIGKNFVDVFYKVPQAGSPIYSSAILRILADENIYAFISWLDQEIMFWNERCYNNEIPEDILGIFCFSFNKNLKEFTDKYIFNRILCDRGFFTPKTWLLSEYLTKVNVVLPILIKPRISSGSRNIFIIKDRLSFDYHLHYIKGSKDFIVQEYIFGPEYTVDFFSLGGKVSNIVVRKRIEYTSVSLRGEIIHNRDIEDIVSKFGSDFKIDGLNNIQIIEFKGRYCITDFNPRPSGTIMFSINAGVDFLKNVMEKKENKKITIYRKPKKIKMIRFLSEYYYE